MPAAVLLTHLLVAITLLASAALKFGADGRAQLAASFVSLRVPSSLSRPGIVRAVPVLEVVLGLGILLAPHPADLPFLVGALLLLLAYLLLVTRAAASDEEADCGCFGPRPEPVTWRTVVRNAVLVASAALALADGLAGHATLGRIADLTGPGWAWLAGVAITALLVGVIASGRSAAVGGRQGQPAAPVPVPDQPLETPPQRAGIPYVELRLPDESVIPMPGLAALQPALLVRLSIGCAACEEVSEVISGWQGQAPGMAIHVVHREEQPDPRWPAPVYDLNNQAASALGSSTPAAVLLGADALIAGGPVFGPEAVTDLFEEARDVLADLTDDLGPVPGRPDPGQEPQAEGSVL